MGEKERGREKGERKGKEQKGRKEMKWNSNGTKIYINQIIPIVIIILQFKYLFFICKNKNFMWLDLIIITTIIAQLLYASTRHSVSITAFFSQYTSLRQIQMYHPSLQFINPRVLRAQVFSQVQSKFIWQRNLT